MAGCKTVFLCTVILAFFPSQHNSLTHPYFVWLLLGYYVQITEQMSNCEISVYSHTLRSRRQLQSNQKNHEHQKHFWNVIVLQEKSQSGVRKLNRKQDRLLVCGLSEIISWPIKNKEFKSFAEMFLELF